MVSKQRILTEYSKIKNNGMGIDDQAQTISVKLGADSAEIIRVIYESGK
jgi:hypothetical protein